MEKKCEAVISFDGQASPCPSEAIGVAYIAFPAGHMHGQILCAAHGELVETEPSIIVCSDRMRLPDEFSRATYAVWVDLTPIGGILGDEEVRA